MERAANDLYVTPSALTRRIQRLEVELGVVLLDRHFKPPKLTQAGFEVLEKSRAILSSLSDLNASTSGTTVPVGPFRLGLSHALAQSGISQVIVKLGKRFPLLQPSISNDISCQLLARLHAGELDGALVVLPAEMALPNDLDGAMLAHETMQLVQARPGQGFRNCRNRTFIDGVGFLIPWDVWCERRLRIGWNGWALPSLSPPNCTIRAYSCRSLLEMWV
jgi:DNA-binding transcriptional LysR family regulator